MAGTENLDATQHSSLQWEVHQDVFAPQPLPRITRAYERAPRSAHAPRLHGQKIWKRPGLHSSSNDDKENEEAVQLELGMGGAGSRKKARVVGAKEDIRDPKWLDDSKAELNAGSLVVVNTPKKRRLGLAVHSLDCLGGRKRTNAGRAVSPRRPLGTKSDNEKIESTSPLKGNGSPLKVYEKPLLKVYGNPTKDHESPEKPARRRRPMRRSPGRRLTFVPEDLQVGSHSRRGSLRQVSVFEVKGLENGIQKIPTAIDNSSLLPSTEEPSHATLSHMEVPTINSEQISPLDMASQPDEERFTKSLAATAATPLQDSANLAGSKLVDSDLGLTGATMALHEAISLETASKVVAIFNHTQEAVELNTSEEVSNHVHAEKVPFSNTSDTNHSTLLIEQMAEMDEPKVEDSSVDETLELVSEIRFTNTAPNNRESVETHVDGHMSSEMSPESTSMLESFEDEVTEDEDDKIEDVSMEEPTLQNFEGLSVIDESPEEDIDEKTEEEELAEQLFATSPMKSQAAPPSPKLFEEESTMSRLEVKVSVISDMDQEATVKEPELPSQQVAIRTPVKERRSSRRLSERPSTRRSTRIARMSLSQSKDDAAESTPVESPSKAMSRVRSSPVKSMRPQISSPRPDSTIQLLFNQESSRTAPIEEQDPIDLQEAVVELREHSEEVVRPVEVEELGHSYLAPSQEPDSQNLEDRNMSTDVDEVTRIQEDVDQTPTTSPTTIEPPASHMLSEGPIDFSEKLQEEINATPDESPESSFATEDSTITELDDDNQQTTTLEIDVDQSMDESLEILEPISIILANSDSIKNGTDTTEGSAQLLVVDSSAPAEEASDDTRVLNFDHDDTNVLQNFLARANANKAAKAQRGIPKGKRSLPHSPIRLPLETEAIAVPPDASAKDEFDVGLPAESPQKRRKRNPKTDSEEDITEPQSMRRSGRTRLPVKSSLPAPNFIPVRRLGSDDTTVTLKKNAGKELAALTRNNTRKNKAGAIMPLDLLAKLGEKEDPATRQRALKEVFDEKAHRKKGKKGKTVIWAEQLNHYQGDPVKNEDVDDMGSDFLEALEKKIEVVKEISKELEKPVDKAESIKDEKPKVKPKSVSLAKIATPVKSSIPRVSMKSKIALGMAVNGTPAPKRQMRSRS
ncbi:hypothetical protein BJ875DRAFT_1140 [Amylocarpus encephaloides]|uniref:Uncharacterized protein n=1 Tax=Amylocarpus encephaloides TaxID=45428 RepID=A0A9P8CAP2_9HELO|nr:hypothetical protein BJ875DRAFT_1140 [Amylocarpus encephaloides]